MMEQMEKSLLYREMLLRQDPAQVEGLMRFFKTGPGQYGEGDQFLGIKVPVTREVVKECWRETGFPDLEECIVSSYHEVRLAALLSLVEIFQHAKKDPSLQRQCIDFYLAHTQYINNWDLVDLSVHKILGHWLLLPSRLGDRDYKIALLDSLAFSDNLWKQRMSMVCTWKTTQMGDPSWCLRYAEIHLHHPHDLMHKAVGWMLREMGKRISMDLLRDFLHLHAHEMPRTALRYAIEKMPEQERQYWLNRKINTQSKK